MTQQEKIKAMLKRKQEQLDRVEDLNTVENPTVAHFKDAFIEEITQDIKELESIIKS